MPKNLDLLSLKLDFESLTKLKVLLICRLTEKNFGLVPKLRGIIICPEMGCRTKAPKRVKTTRARQKSVAKAGRSVKRLSPCTSLPVVMLKGIPDLKIIMGLISIFENVRSQPPA